MAPEQFEGKAVFASDIYSLGITMYQMLTGVLPYESPTPSDLERLMRAELVQPPRVRNPSIPAALNDVVMKAMAPDLANRYGQAQELLDALLAAGGTADSQASRQPRRAAAARRASDGRHARGYAAGRGARRGRPRRSACTATNRCTHAPGVARFAAKRSDATL